MVIHHDLFMIKNIVTYEVTQNNEKKKKKIINQKKTIIFY